MDVTSSYDEYSFYDNDVVRNVFLKKTENAPVQGYWRGNLQPQSLYYIFEAFQQRPHVTETYTGILPAIHYQIFKMGLYTFSVKIQQ